MAENDPNGWAKAPGFNTWGHVGVAKDNAFYQLLDETKEKTDAIFEVVNLTFDLVNSALDFIASLLIDFTNPLKPIIEEIIALLESFISDLRNLGWYVTWDKKEFKKPAEKLLGGYPAFESRMIKKLLDLKDPTRPNFSPESKVFAMTFFAGADASKLGAIIAYIKKLLKLFLSFKGDSDKAEAPINVQVGYYNDLVGDIEIPNLYKPDGVRIKWNLPAPPSTNKVFPKTFILPDYFLFSVATRITNDKIATKRRVPRSPTETLQISLFGPDKSEVQDLVGGITDPRLWPLIQTDAEFTKLDEDTFFLPLKLEDGIGHTGCFILKGEDTLYLNRIEHPIEGKKISDVYRCFIYGGGGGGLVGDNDFSFDIPLDSLKIDGNLESEYYITMYSLTIDSDDYDSISKTTIELPGLLRTGSTQDQLVGGDFLVPQRVGAGSYTLTMPKGSLSKPSAIVTVKSPSDIREKYLKAVKFYWLAHLLAQPYIDYNRKRLGFDDPVGKELTLISLLGDTANSDLYDELQTIQEFAKGAIDWLRKIMLKFKSEMPSDATLNSLKSTLDKINEFPLDLDKMVKDTAYGGEVSIFPTASQFEVAGITRQMLTPIASNYDTDTLTAFKDQITHDGWPESKSPVIADLDVFIGHLFLHKDFKETFRLAQRVVTLSPPVAKETGNWLTQRPFRDADLSALTEFIDTVKKYMEGFLKGLEGIVSQILKFIHMLKTRIAQVQAIIAKIKALIDLILSFRFPAGLYGTFHLADGTAGLISALQQSVDKPDIGSGGYGTGAMVVAGGIPTILIDFFIALMGGEGED
jgi:hypothetical protein